MRYLVIYLHFQTYISFFFIFFRWEEFYSEEHQKFYYFNARTETTTWERSNAYHPSSPHVKKSMLHVASVSAASQADLKDMSSQLGDLWLEALVSVQIPRADATRYHNKRRGAM